VDGKAIQQALVNLIDNAIKHSPKGGTVTVGLDVTSDECRVTSGQETGKGGRVREPSRSPGESDSLVTRHPPHVTLFVEDHGDGIPPEEHEKIFERFYRSGSELRRQTQGVGIGLSIVKHIVEAHEGKVRVRSAVGEGSRFTIELPFKNDA
jgi:signal transduction histidine kinase